MPSLQASEFFRPTSGDEVVRLLTKYGSRAAILGGGTFLHGLAARGLSMVEALIDLHELGLSYVQPKDGALVIGAATTFAQLLGADALLSNPGWGAIKDALWYPPAQIRNMATVGGCIASASPLTDLPVAFMALDGAVQALGPGGVREISLDKFFLDYFEHALEAGEFLTQVRLPKPPTGSASAFLKLETNANDMALVNVAVAIAVDETGTCRQAHVVFGGGVGNVPARARSCEGLLMGERLNQEVLVRASQALSADLRPISDHRAPAAYRAAMAKVLLRRALDRALSRFDGEPK